MREGQESDLKGLGKVPVVEGEKGFDPRRLQRIQHPIIEIHTFLIYLHIWHKSITHQDQSIPSPVLAQRLS